MASFQATWLRGLKGNMEAKGAAHPKRIDEEAEVLNDSKVLEAAMKELGRRRKWEYFFEKCYTTQEEADEGGRGDGGTHRGKDGVFALYDDGGVRSFRKIKGYNMAIAKFLKNVGDAIDASVALNGVRGKMNGMVGRKEVNKRQSTAMNFRLEAYRRTAKIVEAFPIAVTFESLTEELGESGRSASSGVGDSAVGGRRGGRRQKSERKTTTKTTTTTITTRAVKEATTTTVTSMMTTIMKAPGTRIYSQDGSLPSVPR